MKVTLVNPPWQFGNPVKLYPLGLGYLGAYLRDEGHKEIVLVDLNVEIRSSQDVVSRCVKIIEGTGPEVLGLTCWTVQAPFVIEFVQVYKKLHPEVVIVLGGIHASASWQEMMSLCPADVIVESEGEKTLSELLRALGDNTELDNVAGIAWRHGAIVVKNNSRHHIKDLDALPFPAYDMLPPIEAYQPFNRKYIFSVVASRGCTHHCSFCSGSKFWRVQRRRSPENVVEEIDLLRQRYNVGFVRFEDDDLFSNHAWTVQLLKLLKEKPIPFSCLSRLDSMQEGLAEDLTAAGCAEVYHGFETASPRLLQILGKGLEGWDLQRCRSLIERELIAGLRPTVSAMIGIPTETEAEMNATVDFLAELRSMGARAQLWILTPYPDTKIVKDFNKCLVQVDRWKKFNQFDVFSEEARTAYQGVAQKYKSLIPDFWMFANEAGIEKTGALFVQSKGRLMGVFDFV